MASSNLSGFLVSRPPDERAPSASKAEEKSAYELVAVLWRQGPLPVEALAEATPAMDRATLDGALDYLKRFDMVVVDDHNTVRLTPLAERATRAFAFG